MAKVAPERRKSRPNRGSRARMAKVAPERRKSRSNHESRARTAEVALEWRKSRPNHGSRARIANVAPEPRKSRSNGESRARTAEVALESRKSRPNPETRLHPSHNSSTYSGRLAFFLSNSYNIQVIVYEIINNERRMDMPSNAKDVQVKLVTEIKDDGRKEKMEVNEPGQFYQRGDTKVLTFTEHPDEGDAIKTMVTVKPSHVSIKRSGGVEMRQVFQPEVETENIYHHTYGDFHMRTVTEKMEFQLLEEASKGKLTLRYQMTLNHEVTQAHSLTLTFEEES
ncbi:DUF1934 domain-containing protein [Halobacillus litoralis]|uniref:DUF1934 domain-containing protein n=1 Tax=Halobacillus litoralis TaxID=45668 RepID=UPI001CD66CA3|nr:DUF1934 domain-containing protein [Halobacillus litoralis]MCA0971062.1 DUF1934 domain-containing protein [Halobacillus litoralis]